MAAKPKEIGLLVVHGMGEQKPFYHVRDTAREIASAVATNPNIIRLALTDETAASDPRIVIDAVVKRKRSSRHVRLYLHEVWWADLGIKGGVFTQLRFWLWGLGQWGAEAVFEGKRSSNTAQLMTLPQFGPRQPGNERPPPWRRLPAQLALFGAGVLAFLTFFTWSAAKTLVRLFSRRAPDPSLIFLFLGDVMTYERPVAPGKGTFEDPDLPIRTTIRRRMVRGMTSMPTKPYDRWYILAHSLGTVPAFNALQETELALPNYLTDAEWQALPRTLKTKTPFVPKGRKPTTHAMMPRRPPWLADDDGISRTELFRRFAGFITYGSPLDKFAALWPRIVPLNKQTQVFRPDCEWLNLHDPTDPVSATLDAFDPPPPDLNEPATGRWIALRPVNIAMRASLVFLLSHIRYLSPRKRRQKAMASAIADALLSGDRLIGAAEMAKAARIPATGYELRVALVALEVILLFAGLLTGAALLLTKIADLVRGDDVGCPGLIDWRKDWCREEFLANVALALLAAVSVALAAGVIRMLSDALRERHR